MDVSERAHSVAAWRGPVQLYEKSTTAVARPGRVALARVRVGEGPRTEEINTLSRTMVYM